MALRVSANQENTLSGVVRDKMHVRTRAGGRSTLSTITNLTQKNTDGTAGSTKPIRTIKVARRLIKPVQEEEECMEIEEISYQVRLEERLAALTLDLPAGVKDIDKDDFDNPQLCPEYAQDMFRYLKLTETRYLPRENFLTGCPTTPKMRTVLIDWLVDVQQQFKLLQETLYLTVSIFDRFMERKGKDIQRKSLQLVGVSCMLVASKIEEIYSPELKDFVYITDDAYSAAEIRAMELKIVQSLNFEFGDPLSINFLRRYSKAGEVDITQHALAKYILEAILLDYELVNLPPSMSAATSLYLSLSMLEEGGEVWTPSLEFYTGYSLDLIQSKAGIVLESLKKAHTGKFAAVKQKFSTKTMQRIAVNEVLNARIKSL